MSRQYLISKGIQVMIQELEKEMYDLTDERDLLDAQNATLRMEIQEIKTELKGIIERVFPDHQMLHGSDLLSAYTAQLLGGIRDMEKSLLRAHGDNVAHQQRIAELEDKLSLQRAHLDFLKSTKEVQDDETAEEIENPPEANEEKE